MFFSELKVLFAFIAREDRIVPTYKGLIAADAGISSAAALEVSIGNLLGCRHD